MSEKDTLTVQAELDQLPAVLSFVDEHLEEAGCSMKAQIQVDLAIEELYVNIAHYAYRGKKGEAQISVRLDPEERIFEIEFRDSGVPFDPLAKPDPDITLSAEERRIGGLGIFMAKKNLDELSYARENGQNVLTARKKL